jgi:hypothetical protein
VHCRRASASLQAAAGDDVAVATLVLFEQERPIKMSLAAIDCVAPASPTIHVYRQRDLAHALTAVGEVKDC